jgi:hypothetical protein
LRKLHLVGLTTDRDGLIFTARKGSKSGGYIVPLDDAVLAAVAEIQADRNGAGAGDAEATEVEAVPRRPRHQSALTPREMQARLRAGRSIEEVAAEAGVDNDWVARFAVPILAEQAQVVELARTLVYAKPRLGPSAHPLGPSVTMNLTDRGVFLPDDVADAGWSAFQLHDSVWMVRFRYRSRGRAQEAQWEVDVPAGRLTARNRHASDLGYVEADRRRKGVAAGEDSDEDPPPPRRSARATPAGKATKATRATKGVATRKAAKPRKAATTSRPPAKKATTTPAKRTTSMGQAVKAAKAAKEPAAKSAAGTRAPEPASTGGSGGVRSAVAQVSTARVSASLASAERTPWAAAVRRPTTGARPAPSNGRESWDRPRSSNRAGDPASGSAFDPRPLPSGSKDPAPAPRVRKVSTSRAESRPADGPKPVSLPAPRQPAPRTEPIPVERAKRRRLRSR